MVRGLRGRQQRAAQEAVDVEHRVPGARRAPAPGAAGAGSGSSRRRRAGRGSAARRPAAASAPSSLPEPPPRRRGGGARAGGRTAGQAEPPARRRWRTAARASRSTSPAAVSARSCGRARRRRRAHRHSRIIWNPHLWLPHDPPAQAGDSGGGDFELHPARHRPRRRTQKICVVMPAYNAEKTLRAHLRRPPQDWVDDSSWSTTLSRDRTVEIARARPPHRRPSEEPRLRRQPEDLLPRGARRAARDIAVMVHPDHQYDPSHPGSW